MDRLLPKTLVGRVFCIFSISSLVLLSASGALFYQLQFSRHIEEVQESASALIELASQPVEESAVIGDYDTIRRTLAKVLHQSPFDSASFIDLSGGTIVLQAESAQPGYSPEWLQAVMAERFSNVNRIVTVGGKDYGVMRLSFDSKTLAAELWSFSVQAAAISCLWLLGCLALTGFLLRRWLGPLDELRSLESNVISGDTNAQVRLLLHAPAEIKEAIGAVNRTAASMRSQFGNHIEVLMAALVQHKNAMDEACIVCETDADGRITYVNEQFKRQFCNSNLRLLGLNLRDVGQANQNGWRWSPGLGIWRGEVQLTLEAAEEWRQRTVVPVHKHNGADVEKYICIDIDITERKKFERKATDDARMQEVLANFAHRALLPESLDEISGMAVEAVVAGLMHYQSALMLPDSAGSWHAMLGGAGWQDQSQPVELMQAMDLASLTSSAIEIRPLSVEECLLPPAFARQVSGKAEVGFFSEGRILGSLGVYSSENQLTLSKEEEQFLGTLGRSLCAVIERQLAKARLTHFARHDQLTSLPNRRHLSDWMEATLHAAREAKARFGILFIDLDRFKNVNDLLGHGLGDQLLIQAGMRIKEVLGPGDFLARLGGDEFAVVSASSGDTTHAVGLAESIVSALVVPFSLNGQTVFVSASVGLAFYPDDGATASVLLRNADLAMYSAKSGGRGQYHCYHSGLNRTAARRVLLETHLHQALERDQFELHLQPKVSLATGAVSGFEALLRWSPDGMEPPTAAEFIPILEESGMIVEVGEWVIREGVDQICRWRTAGLEPLPIAVNISVRQFERAGFAEAVGQILAQAKVGADLIEFELTESMLIQDPESAATTLNKLKGLGFRLSIDDFGTGYSSLAYLKRLPLDSLKIDRTFIRDLPLDSEDTAITRAIIGLAHSLDLTVVAEGVETKEQMETLRQNGCDEMQGYIHSRPQPASECEKWLRRIALGEHARLEDSPFERNS